MQTILYIEDNPQNMRLVKKYLRVGGYNMIGAIDGLSGVEMAIKEQPDIILIDINLPDIDGLEVTRRLQANDSTRHIPMIALTANVMHGDRERCVEAGCDDYLAKPVSRQELYNTIEKYLDEVATAPLPVVDTAYLNS